MTKEMRVIEIPKAENVVKTSESQDKNLKKQSTTSLRRVINRMRGMVLIIHSTGSWDDKLLFRQTELTVILEYL